MEINGLRVGERYVHFKGNDKVYEIIALARDCERFEDIKVIYKQLYATDDFPMGTVWSRSLEEFCSEKELDSGLKIKRFRRVE